MVYGLGLMVYGVWFIDLLVYGLLVYGLWFIGLRFMVYWFIG